LDALEPVAMASEGLMTPRMIHDHAYAIAMHLVSVFESLLRDDERRDAFDECYNAAKAGLECYELMANRTRKRLFGASAN
jgi:hypothetical protein